MIFEVLIIRPQNYTFFFKHQTQPLLLCPQPPVPGPRLVVVARSPVSRLRRGPLPPSRDADHPGHLVQVEALAALDESLVVVMLPGGKHEQPPSSAGVKPAAPRLGKRREAVLLKHNDGKPLLKCRLHHCLFTGADARRNENRSVLGMRQELLHGIVDLLCCEFAGTLHLY